MRKSFFKEALVCFSFVTVDEVKSESVTTTSPGDSITVTRDLRFNLNESGSNYFRLTFLNQTWLRINDNNPGTTVFGNPASNTFDIGLRRTRIQMYGQLTDRLFIYTQFGFNNFNKTSAFPGYNQEGTPSNRKISAFFHDALGEFEAWRKEDQFVRVGAGLTVVNGLSRFTQPSVGTIMTMDVPVFAQATVDQIDQFDRKLTVYSRGQLGKMNYRIGVSDPFPVETSGSTAVPLGVNSTFAGRKHAKSYQGMLIYNFLDTEESVVPGYMTGTYLGKRNVLNLEAGIISQRNATWRTNGADTLYNNMMLWSIGSYLDLPLKRARGSALSAYIGYYKTQYGSGYLRFNGIMNPATGTDRPLEGVTATHGNAFPMFGNGSVVYGQAGFKFPDDMLGKSGTLMPYASVQYARYDRIERGVSVWNAGVNWLIKGHNGKVTVNYEDRPTYQNDVINANTLRRLGRKGALVVQYQLSI